MKNMIYTFLFFSLIISNEVFASAPPIRVYETKAGIGDVNCRHVLNEALGVASPDSPLYFIIVTRTDEGDMLQPQRWNDVLNALEDICGDNDGIKYLNSSSSNASNLLNYIQTHKHELMNSCKMVVFSEYFCKRKPLTNDEYNEFINGDAGYRGLKTLSRQCTKSVFYPHFLYSEPYNKTNTDHTEILKTYSQITREGVDFVNSSRVGDASIEGARGFLGHLSFVLSLSESQNYPEEAIRGLADVLRVGSLTEYNAKQLSIKLNEILADPTNRTTINVVMDRDNVEALYAALNKFPLNESCPADSPILPLIQLARLAFNLKTQADAILCGGDIGGTAFFLRNFAKIRDEASQKTQKIKSRSFMVPVRGEFVDNVMHNVTPSVHRGSILTKYKKATYCQEDDAMVSGTRILSNTVVFYSGSIYDFGNGYDIASPFWQDCITLPNGQEVIAHLLDSRDSLLKTIAVEHAFDLANGVRHSNGWANDVLNNTGKQSDFLILQTVDPVKDDDGNFKHLPRSSAGHEVYIVNAADNFNNSPDILPPPIGSHIFKIDTLGITTLFKEETIDGHPVSFDFGGVKITLYKL